VEDPFNFSMTSIVRRCQRFYYIRTIIVVTIYCRFTFSSTMTQITATTVLCLLAVALSWLSQPTRAFQGPPSMTTSASATNRPTNHYPLFMEGQQYQTPQNDESQNLLAARTFLQENYPIFYSILQKNDDVWKAIGEDDADKGEIGFTIFAVSDASLQQLGDKKASQLMDPRNLETTQRIAGYHVLSETVTAEQLFNCGAVVTSSGEIPVDQEDGGVLINKAKATQTWQVGTGLVHEVEGLVCPNIMWRYMDQLRIPGSR
jgi:uncharacterized surface protein with fasciclin (FAS1) repeats